MTGAPSVIKMHTRAVSCHRANYSHAEGNSGPCHPRVSARVGFQLPRAATTHVLGALLIHDLPSLSIYTPE